MRLINYRFSPRRDEEEDEVAAALLDRCRSRGFFATRASGGGRYDVVARKNAPRDNCMYVNDGVISLRLLSKRTKYTCERERVGERV